MGAATPKDVVKQYLDYLGSGNAEGLVAMHTEDSVIDMPGSADLPWAGRWQGSDRIREYFQVMPAALEIKSHTVTAWVVDGDRVAVSGTEAGASRRSGKEYQAKWCWVFTVEGDRIALWDAYEDTEALAACGPWR
jgi:ketosteroid isomerase-like protein